MLKKQLEAGKLAATAGGGGGLSSQQGGGGLTNQEQVVSSSAPPPQPPQQEMYNNYQQATTVTQGSDEYEYGQQQPQYADNGGYGYDSQQYQQDTTTSQQQPEQFPNCNSIGSLAPLNPNGLSSISSFGRMFKTDSHAVLMELFARDQDLVKQASGQKGGMIQAAAVGNTTGSGSGSVGMTNGISSASMAREINKEMMNNPATNAAGSLLSSAAAASSTTGNLRSTYNNNNSSSGSPQQQKVTFGNNTNTQSSTVPSLSSWPHFSSVSSLNNMGSSTAGNNLGLKGVKSITNLSAADLSSQGNLNKMGNLAHVKSIENMVRSACFVLCLVLCVLGCVLTYDILPFRHPASLRDVVTPLPSWKSSLMTRVDWGVAAVMLVVAAAVVNGVSRENVKKMIMPLAYHLMGMTAPRQIPSHPRPLLLSLLIQQYPPRLLFPRMA